MAKQGRTERRHDYRQYIKLMKRRARNGCPVATDFLKDYQYARDPMTRAQVLAESADVMARVLYQEAGRPYGDTPEGFDRWHAEQNAQVDREAA